MKHPNFVIGIGASEHGLDALESFLQGVPQHTGAAYVAIHENAADFGGVTDKVLGSDIGIPVHRAEDGVALEPDHVYIAAPNQRTLFNQGRLTLKAPSPQQPVDVFFSSLASTLGERAAGVILSGRRADGSEGVRRIHEAGGYVAAQDPSSARFNAMPEAAISTGAVDHTAPAHLIARAALAHMDRRGLRRGENDPDRSVFVDQIFHLIRRRFDIDFRKYQSSTIVPRLERRIRVVGSHGLKPYVDLVSADPIELEHLYYDLLTGVTEFFSDPGAFSFLAEQVVPGLFDRLRGGDQPLRVWCPGCGTGADTYSLAILLAEHQERTDRTRPIRIFATDVYDTALERASAGVFDPSIAQRVSPERLERYFDNLGATYRVTEQLRRQIVFAPHNVVTDPPLEDLHLIVCRNLLNYFDRTAQEEVLSSFGKGLREQGALLLGQCEAISSGTRAFKALSPKWKVYEKSAAPAEANPEELRAENRELRRTNAALQAAVARHQEEIQTLRQLASALEAQQHDLQDFAYVATHDLQAPARAVVGFADLVGRELNGHGTPKQKEWLGNIRRAGFEMQNLIDGLHTLSRVYSGGAPATELSCDTILDAALESRAERIDDRAVIVSRSPLPSIKVDGQQFQQLLSHLIDNAITFNESDVPRVYVDATQTDSEWVFSIRDNGIGIPEQFHDEVFTVFRRLNPKSEFDGNGLGLAMCKRIVQRHGGRIWLDSSPAAGTTVYFSIPANRTREDVASPADDDVSGSEM